MRFDCYYLFYDRPNKTLVRLDLLRTDGMESFSPCTTTSGRFKLLGQLYDDEDEFVDSINRFNNRMFSVYFNKFKLYAPYKFLHRLYDNGFGEIKHGISVNVAGNYFSINDGEQLPDFIINGKYPCFENIHRTCFDVETMLQFHHKFMASVIFRGGYDSKGIYYIVHFGGDFFFGRIAKDEYAQTFYLNIQDGRTNGYVFKYLNITREKIARYLPNQEWYGGWPQTTEDNLFAIMRYINHNYISFVKEGLVITEDSVKSNNKVYPFKQNVKGKWYLSGDIDQILKMLNIESINSLRKIMNLYFGTKNRPGVFPECDTKEELKELIKKIIDGKRS